MTTEVTTKLEHGGDALEASEMIHNFGECYKRWCSCYVTAEYLLVLTTTGHRDRDELK